MAVSSGDRHWIPLAAAIKQIVDSSLLDGFGAAALIESGLIAGKLRTRARAVRSIGKAKADLSVANRKCTAQSEPFREIADAFWKRQFHFSASMWEELDFGAPISVAMSQPPDFEIEDLQINKANLRRWILTGGSASISPSQRGRPPKEQAWAYLIALLVEETRKTGLTERDFPKPTSLLRLLHDDWDEREDNPNVQAVDDPGVLDDRTISKVLEDVWESVVRGTSK